MIRKMNSSTTTRRKRRSHWQIAAARKLKWAYHEYGDGQYIVLSRCPHSSGERFWVYWLFETMSEAAAKLAELNSVACGNACKGLHSTWELKPWD